ncbi:MAG: GNAT family N-acetyltransferase [Chthoniobacteraceae bacterium]
MISDETLAMPDPMSAAPPDLTCLRTRRLDIRACDTCDGAAALGQILAHQAVYEAFYLQAMPRDPAQRILEPWGCRAPGERVSDWVARERGSGRVTGAVQFAGDNLGFFVSPDAWGQGYGREMVLACCERLPARLGLTELEATVMRENVASRRILERAGFAFAGLHTEPRPRLGVLTLLRYRCPHGAVRPTAGHW